MQKLGDTPLGNTPLGNTANNTAGVMVSLAKPGANGSYWTSSPLPYSKSQLQIPAEITPIRKLPEDREEVCVVAPRRRRFREVPYEVNHQLPRAVRHGPWPAVPQRRSFERGRFLRDRIARRHGVRELILRNGLIWVLRYYNRRAFTLGQRLYTKLSNLIPLGDVVSYLMRHFHESTIDILETNDWILKAFETMLLLIQIYFLFALLYVLVYFMGPVGEWIVMLLIIYIVFSLASR